MGKTLLDQLKQVYTPLGIVTLTAGQGEFGKACGCLIVPFHISATVFPLQSLLMQCGFIIVSL